jgi:hypothetical protein
MTIHSTNYALFENNVCFDIKGHAFFLENAIEIGNKFKGNIGMKIQQSLLLPSDSQPSVFWITNANNSFIQNVASGSANTCFWFLGNPVPLNEASGIDVKPIYAPWGTFIGNSAHSCRMGLRFDEQINPISNAFEFGYVDPRVDGKSTGALSPISTPNTLVHHTYDIAVWVRSGLNNEYSCVGCILGDNRLGFRLSSHHFVNDSLIVGLSKNHDCLKIDNGLKMEPLLERNPAQ